MANAWSTQQKYELLKPVLNERTRRLFAAAEAKVMGWGGITAVVKATGISRVTIWRGIEELKSEKALDPERIRREGGGRKKEVEKDPRLRKDLESLIEPHTRGEPESVLHWSSKSVRKLSKELGQRGHQASHRMVAELLHGMKFSLQANRKTKEGKQHPDRNAQFEYIHRKVKSQLRKKEPAISVDTKKKELVGNFKNAGQEWRLQGKPKEVRVHDFMIKELGKVSPYGVYDLSRNRGWVSVGIDHDTAQFAVESIRQWWREMGKLVYPQAETLLITADGGGSNGSRNRLWKCELQKLSNQLGLAISVLHFPPGTSKWNKIEHRMFSFITQNWRGKPLLSRAVIVNLIASTRTETGLKIRCRLDTRKYPAGIKVLDSELEQLNLRHHRFHGDWNYTIYPNRKTNIR